MKTQFICPGCQSAFKEAISSVDFTTKCPHCGIEVLIAADPAEVEKANKEAAKKAEATMAHHRREAEQKAKAEAERVEAARKEAEEKAKAEAERAASRKREEENAKAVAKGRYSVKRICPHCGCENTWEVNVEPGVESYIVSCQGGGGGCGKPFTIQLNPLNEIVVPLTDIIYELRRIKFLIGFLFFWLVVLPLICWAIIANIHK